MAIGRAMAFNTHLLILDMSTNSVGNEAARAFGEALIVNNKLATLALQSTGITDDGVIGKSVCSLS